MPREVEQQFFLKRGSLSPCPCLQYNWHLQNRCIDRCRVFLSFCFGSLTVYLLSWYQAWLCLLTHVRTLAAAPWLFHIAASPVQVSSCSWLRSGSFWLWSLDIPDLAQTTQLNVFLTSLLTTKCSLFTAQFLSIKLIKQPSFYRAADPLVFPPFGMLKVPKAARIPLSPFFKAVSWVKKQLPQEWEVSWHIEEPPPTVCVHCALKKLPLSIKIHHCRHWCISTRDESKPWGWIQT